MSLREITEGLPEELTSQLRLDEKVYYFSYISFKGGCLSSKSRQEYWISVTNKRVIYKTRIKEDNKFIEKDGILPFEEISFIEVTEFEEKSGCSSAKAFQLRISTSGGTAIIPIPTKEKGYEIRKVYSDIIEMLEKKK
jgi:hypothetical protein